MWANADSHPLRFMRFIDIDIKYINYNCKYEFLELFVKLDFLFIIFYRKLSCYIILTLCEYIFKMKLYKMLFL